MVDSQDELDALLLTELLKEAVELLQDSSHAERQTFLVKIARRFPNWSVTIR